MNLKKIEFKRNKKELEEAFKEVGLDMKIEITEQCAIDLFGLSRILNDMLINDARGTAAERFRVFNLSLLIGREAEVITAILYEQHKR